MKKVEIITDGSCLRNPGPGGWACILRYNGHVKELSGAEPQSTNNRMELMAAIQGIAVLKERCQITITTDSEYLRKGITQWIKGWKRNGWKTKEGKPVLNREL